MSMEPIQIFCGVQSDWVGEAQLLSTTLVGAMAVGIPALLWMLDKKREANRAKILQSAVVRRAIPDVIEAVEGNNEPRAHVSKTVFLSKNTSQITVNKADVAACIPEGLIELTNSPDLLPYVPSSVIDAVRVARRHNALIAKYFDKNDIIKRGMIGLLEEKSKINFKEISEKFLAAHKDLEQLEVKLGKSLA